MSQFSRKVIAGTATGLLAGTVVEIGEHAKPEVEPKAELADEKGIVKKEGEPHTPEREPTFRYMAEAPGMYLSVAMPHDIDRFEHLYGGRKVVIRKIG